MNLKKFAVEISLSLFGAGLTLSSLLTARVASLPAWPAQLAGRENAVSQIILMLGLLSMAFALHGWLRLKQGKKSWSEGGLGFLRSFPGQAGAGFRGLASWNFMPDDESRWLAPILATGASVYAYFLSQPMRGDEAYTFLNYVNDSLWSMFRYSEPNNHVLHTLLARLSVFLFGAEPAAIRFPAFLAGLGSIALVFYLARALGRVPGAGLLAAAGTATFPFLALYATNARGYTLVVFLLLALGLLGLRFAESPSRPKLLALGFLSAAALLAIPAAILGVAGLYLWIALMLYHNKKEWKWILFEFTFPYGLVGGGLTFLFYLPVILVTGDAASIVANKFVAPIPREETLAQLFPSILQSFDQLTRDIPPLLIFGGLALIIPGWIIALKRKDWGLFWLLPSLFLGGLLITLAQSRLPYARSWVYFIPFTLAVIDYGFAHLIRYLPGFYQRAAKVAVLAGGIFLGSMLVSNNVIAKYPDTSAFPEAAIVAQYLKPILTENDAIHVTTTANVSVHFYFWYYDMPGRDLPRRTETGRTFYIVKKSRYAIEDMTDKPVNKLLDIGDMQLFELIEK